MKEITRQMIRQYKLKKLGIDFMSYQYSDRWASYHHLIVPKRLGGEETKQNGAVLMRNTAHDYLHKIELIDKEIFCYITQAMMVENQLGRLDEDSLKMINDLLTYFEREHCGDRNHNGKPIIKEEYVRKRIKRL